MRIGIDVRTISTSNRGFRRLQNLIHALACVADREQFVLFGASGEWCRPLLETRRFIAEDPKRRLRMLYRRGVGLFWRPWFHDLSVMHFPTADVWYSRRCRTIVTLHDLAQLRLPHLFFRSRRQYRRFVQHLDAIARISEVIATVSEFSRREIIERMGVAPARVCVIRQGIDPRLGQSLSAMSATQQVQILRRYDLVPGRYVLYCGGLDARKNVALLLESIAHIRQTHKAKAEDLQLMIVGNWDPADPVQYPDLPAAAERIGLRKCVLFPGWVSDQDLAALYAHCGVFAYPSIMEGFGYAPLEAMACGAPVVCSNSAALPETVGGAAELVSPNDASAWADALWRVLTDEAHRTDLVRRGRDHVRQFDWRKTARGFLALYHGRRDESQPIAAPAPAEIP